MLATIGLTRQENVYITNLIYWRPPGNRDPSPVEMQICAPFLMRQIELKTAEAAAHRRQVRDARDARTPKTASCACAAASSSTGRTACPRRSPACPLLHPAYLLRRREDKAKAWDDLRTIAAMCDELGIKRGPAL